MILITTSTQEESDKLKDELKKANEAVTTHQLAQKTLEAELKAMKDEMGRFINDQVLINYYYSWLLSLWLELSNRMNSMI